jgi:predicted RNA-binding protein with PUA-like domain
VAYWLFKSEPTAFSLDDLKACPNSIDHWDGVRNYQARNFLRDKVKKGDSVFFYHSNCKPPGIVGIAKVTKEGYEDFTASDPEGDHYDPKHSKESPLWYMVDIQFQRPLKQLISLETLKNQPGLSNFPLVRKGNRLSVLPVSEEEWQLILALE